MSVVALLEGVELAIVGAAVRVDLRVPVPIQDAPHGPLAIHEAAIAHLQGHAGRAAWAAQVLHLFLDGEDTEALVDRHELLEGRALRVVAVAEPGQAICDLTVPGGILLPGHLFYVLNGVESEVDAEGDLETLRLVRIVHGCRVGEGRTYEGGVLPAEVRGIKDQRWHHLEWGDGYLLLFAHYDQIHLIVLFVLAVAPAAAVRDLLVARRLRGLSGKQTTHDLIIEQAEKVLKGLTLVGEDLVRDGDGRHLPEDVLF